MYIIYIPITHSFLSITILPVYHKCTVDYYILQPDTIKLTMYGDRRGPVVYRQGHVDWDRISHSKNWENVNRDSNSVHQLQKLNAASWQKANHLQELIVEENNIQVIVE